MATAADASAGAGPAGRAVGTQVVSPEHDSLVRLATRRFLRWIHSKDVFEKWFVTQRGFSVGATTVWEQHPIWNEDPVMLPYRNAARAGRVPGYAGTSNAKAAEVVTKYVITNMYAKAVQGDDARAGGPRGACGGGTDLRGLRHLD